MHKSLLLFKWPYMKNDPDMNDEAWTDFDKMEL